MSRRRAHSRHGTARDVSRLVPIDDDPIEALIRRSKRQRRRGDQRAAVVLLQRACSMDEWRARTFTLLGALLSEVGRCDEAERAFLHARWLRQRAGEMSRAEVTMRLVDRVRASRAVP
ncbi:MAG: hypothetical protein IPM54_26755 [Polyangiaceae bacterium]|nr:hypothetical protein [Polyangiaceae bacterium]